jgi:hypothetical protein
VLSEGIYGASEGALEILRESGLDPESVASGFRILHSYTIGYVAMEIARRAVDPERYRAFEASRFPTRAEYEAFLGPFDERQFEIGLDVILRGLAARV